MLNKNTKIFIAGHNGMVGSAIRRKLLQKGFRNLILKNRNKLDLLDQKQTYSFLKRAKPNFVIVAAAVVGGINANARFKHKFLFQNLQIQNNIIHGSYLAGVKNLYFLGSSCIYPKYCKQPMRESSLLTGPLEESNDAYAIAKIAGLKLCEFYSINHKVNYKSFMPPNMYGPNDNYDLSTSHFFPALIRKIYDCKIKNKKILKLWGSGKARRELMFVEDFADAVVFFMKKKIKEPYLNIGTGKDFSIGWYAKFLMNQMNVKLILNYDRSKPDGMPRKCLDTSLSKKYGWEIKNDLKKGFRLTFNDFIKRKI